MHAVAPIYSRRCSLDAKLSKVTNLDSRFHHHKVWPTELPSPCKWEIPQKTYWPTTNLFFGYFGRYKSQISRLPEWTKWSTRKPANTPSPIKTISSTGEPKTSGQAHLLRTWKGGNCCVWITDLQVSLFSCLALISFLYIDLILHDSCIALNSYLPFLSLLCIKTMLLCSDI